MFHFPEILGEENFDYVMCSEYGRIYVKEVKTGKVEEVLAELRSYFLSLPENCTIGILMPDGSVGKITPLRN